MSHTEIFTSIWAVVESVNSLAEFEIQYPTDQSTQKMIADDFQAVSGVGFDNCGGAIDGVLIWMEKPSQIDAQESGLSRKKLLCARKNKFGLNMQAVSDCRGRILDLSINYGRASADIIAFEASDLYDKLEKGLLRNSRLALFGDNAYVNKCYMATPFPNVSSGGEDIYNFYHSQLRIQVECCCGQFVHRWGILRTNLKEDYNKTCHCYGQLSCTTPQFLY